MIYKSIELLNYEEVIEVPGRPGVLLQRIPENIRLQLRPDARHVYRQSACGEIRFVSGSKPAKITLASYDGSSKALLYFGSFQVAEYIINESPTVINIEAPFPDFILRPEFDTSLYPFSISVIRLILRGNEIHLIDIDGEDIRPPQKYELPKLRYLAYGTSITQGVNATAADLTYVSQVGWRLGTDVINLGASGAAYCEKAMTDYIAARKDWDFASICISGNMLNQGITADDFRKAAEYMVCRVAENNPDKPLICISLTTAFWDLGFTWPGRDVKATAQEYRSALEDIVLNSGLSNIHYIDGRQLLTSYYGLSHDLIHPGNNGMIEIGENLSKFIRSLLEPQGQSLCPDS